MPLDNVSHRTNFAISFEKIPNAVFQIRNAVLPSVSIGETRVPNPSVDYSIPGDKIDFEKFTFSFLVDENFDNYNEVLKWIMDMRSPENNGQGEDILSDATLMILSNNKNPIRNFSFKDCFPIYIGAIGFEFI